MRTVQEMAKMDKLELLEEYRRVQPNSIDSGMVEKVLLVHCTQDIVGSIERHKESLAENAAASDRLAQRVFWLNIAIAAATIIGVLAALVQAYAAYKSIH